MPTSFGPRLRDSSALAITISLHAAVAGLALLVVSNAVPQRLPRSPIITRPIPEPVTAPPIADTPTIDEQPIITTIAEPIIETDPAPPTDVPIGVASEPLVVSGSGSGTSGAGTSADPKPSGVTTIPRFDPRYIGNQQPPYPTASRRLGEEGVVIVHVTIGRDGRVVSATLARSSGSARLDEAAVAHALARWRFTPALSDGTPVVAERDISVRFRLADGGR